MSTSTPTKLSTTQITCVISSAIVGLASFATGLTLYMTSLSEQVQVQIDASDGTITEATEYYQRLVGSESQSSLAISLIGAGIIAIALTLIGIAVLNRRVQKVSPTIAEFEIDETPVIEVKSIDEQEVISGSETIAQSLSQENETQDEETASNELEDTNVAGEDEEATELKITNKN